MRIVFTGAGTSAFIGGVVAPLLTEKLGVLVEAIASTDLVSSPYAYFLANKPTLLVSFGRSGNSPESIGAVENLHASVKEAYHLAITNNAQGALAKCCVGDPKSFALTLSDCTHDAGFAMTSSASNMMIAALLAFGSEYFSEKWLADVVNACEMLLQTQVEQMAEIAKMPVERVVYLGSGAFQALARECALKLLELTAGQDLGFFESAMGFRHGPKSLVNHDTLIFLFISQHPYTARYDWDLVNELCQDHKAQAVLPLGEPSSQGFALPLGELDDAGRVFPFLMVGQLYAFFRSINAGITTDNPCPTGEVNRVVQGVTLYSYQP